MKQIILNKYYKKDTNSIIGKTIKDVSYISGEESIDPQLIITFTDDTYIYLTASTDEYAEIILKNENVIPLQSYTYPPGNVVIDEDGNKTFKYRHNIEEQIRLGLLKSDRERELIRIKEYEERSYKRDYELYLQLKRKLNIDKSIESPIKQSDKIKNKVKFFVKAIGDNKYHLYIEDKNENFIFISTHLDFNSFNLDIKDFTDMKEGQLREVYLNLEN